MTPSARLQAAIDILTELERTNAPADRFMREWFRARRYAGSKDRAAIGQRVFSVFRHRASFAWRMQSETPRALVIASVLAESSSAPTSPEGRSKNARLGEAFFGWGERRNESNVGETAPLPPPEIAKGDFDLPSGEVRRRANARQRSGSQRQVSENAHLRVERSVDVRPASPRESFARATEELPA